MLYPVIGLRNAALNLKDQFKNSSNAVIWTRLIVFLQEYLLSRFL